MTAPIISTVFDPPLPSDSKATFNTKAFALAAALNPFSAQANAVAEYLDDMSAAVGAAEALINFQGAWSALSGSLDMPASVSHAGSVYALTTNVADVTAHTPGVSAAWQVIRADSAQISHGTGTVNDALTSGAVLGHKNLLLNGGFEINQRALIDANSGDYCLDGWHVLSQTGEVRVAQMPNPETGAPWGIWVMQPSAVAKRIGLGQVIEASRCASVVSSVVNAFARVKLSTSGLLRWAVLEWTGSADSVSRNVVANWASTTYTAGNFFIEGVNVLRLGSIAPGAGVWGEIDGSFTVGASAKNLILVIWTDAVLAQGQALEVNRAQVERGAMHTSHDWAFDELERCKRRRRVIPFSRFVFARGTGGGFEASWIDMPPMRATPTLASTLTWSYTNASAATVVAIAPDALQVQYTSTAAHLAQATAGAVTLTAEVGS
jgi:hypothetical protein